MTGSDTTALPDADDAEMDLMSRDIPDFHDRLAPLRERKGVARLRMGGGTIMTLLRHADVAVAVRDDAHYSKSEAFRPTTFPFMGPNIQGYDGNEHVLKRALVSPAFRRAAVPSYVEPVMRPIAEELVTRIAANGAADLMSEFAKWYPMLITTRLLGIPPDDEQMLAAWALKMLDIVHDPEGVHQANAEFTTYITPLIEERRRHPSDDLISAIVTEEVEGQRLSEEEIIGFCRLLFPAGVDTTWLSLGSLIHAVLDHPQEHDRLRADRTERMWAVEETLRWQSPVALEPRVTLTDVEPSGVPIPAGQMVFLVIPSANRDPAVFQDPTQWDLDRRPSKHIAFGLGRHFCLGAHLARVEMEVALDVLLHRLPNLRLVAEPEIGGVVIRGPKELRVEWDAA
ncbi:cytochrome P450 [Mycolicibacterium sp. 050232]|uniref:cytochrome P450 n=1 Tax=Mycolicibacterium sp. 050232 TaxID=3113982 RepID=UPI002E2C4AA9|nr:cytochrome P450 [Mycolicibacterium sp. 050232]MED5813646.1 cytochrome P450 [Mycolicibacterium sp. 050232]